jgi:hypothetical protein
MKDNLSCTPAEIREIPKNTDVAFVNMSIRESKWRQITKSILLYGFYKTLDCDTSWLGHDERSEECSNGTSVTVRLIRRV